ncbi:hypothetical protein B0H14DRAFT_3141256 [Mycena olivaceomarginata]|nr:hypothetical protein B0H14DRAFT_3141256 [Mycena olivaceomarginata]
MRLSRGCLLILWFLKVRVFAGEGRTDRTARKYSSGRGKIGSGMLLWPIVHLPENNGNTSRLARRKRFVSRAIHAQHKYTDLPQNGKTVEGKVRELEVEERHGAGLFAAVIPQPRAPPHHRLIRLAWPNGLRRLAEFEFGLAGVGGRGLGRVNISCSPTGSVGMDPTLMVIIPKEWIHSTLACAHTDDESLFSLLLLDSRPREVRRVTPASIVEEVELLILP